MAKRVYSKPLRFSAIHRDTRWRKSNIKEIRERSLAISERVSLSVCPVCASKEFKGLLSVHTFSYMECDRCHHVFMKDPPSDRAVRELYARQNPNEKDMNVQIYANDELFMTRVKEIAAPKAKFALEHRATVRNGRWVDIGCGGGDLLAALLELGWDVVGLESDASLVNFMHKRGLPVKQAFLDSSNAAELLGDAAVISMINIVEHLNDPRSLINLVASATVEDVTLVIEVPKHPALSSFANITFPDEVARHISPPDHLHIFSEASIEKLLADSGFHIDAFWFFGQDSYEVMMTMINHSDTPTNSYLVERVMESVEKIQKAIDESGLSDTMLVVCSKKKA